MPETSPIPCNFGVFVACGYGVLCAMAVFGYLYNNRSACMMHALPLRRETLFGTQYLAGLSFALLPNLVVAGITLAVELPLVAQKCWGTSLASLGIWLLVQSGVCLFFFSFASFCAMFTGHILALPAFYGILNMLAYVLNMLINGVLSDFFFGLSMHSGRGSALAQILTPIWPLTEAVEWDPVQETVNGMTATTGESVPAEPRYRSRLRRRRCGAGGAGPCWCTGSGRWSRRGTWSPCAWCGPSFLYGVAFCSGLCFGVYTIAFFGWRNRLSLAVCVVVWAVVGYFVARMLLCKSFRVLKYWKGAAASFVVMAVLCVACLTDVMGITAWVPQADEVASVDVDCRINYPYDSGDSTRYQVTDPGQIEKIVALHQAVLDHRDTVDTSSSHYQAGEEYTRLDVTYTLNDGRTVRRCYYDIPIHTEDLNTEGTVTWALNQIAQDRVRGGGYVRL